MTTPPRPLALVTGASSGIGREIADRLAREGHDLVLAAEDEVGLAAAARRTGGRGVDVEQVVGDLRNGSAVEELAAAVGDRPVDVLVLDAGVGVGGPFVEQDVADVLSVVDLDVRSTVHLARLLLPGMVERARGRVLVLSSIAATMPGPHQAVYNASKSFVQSWAEALQRELSGTGVTVTSLMPGPVDTDFFARAGLVGSLMGKGPKDDPADVARAGVEALLAGKRKVYAASPLVKVVGGVNAVLPDGVKAVLHEQVAKLR
ncbi:SDR family NAD(P)-dependent oxidoreductase [Klenkia taihuensis]|uniref:Short-chain dehydrogenase n=1 Tax=Klenkia taihuensis TaxID=1225127 RepID=A0A1I1V3X0_9ACTN|nr:SDR family NAD(P)-dependent oxidoreductase [Klenkia taihuensis]GHE14538.1 oxidoreductase [Klenkia taihuensis]SFD77737.1 Short-chain dehydrogenase [Klenkia taihuensis]